MREYQGGPEQLRRTENPEANIPRVHLAAVIAAFTLAVCGVAQGAMLYTSRVHHYPHHPECVHAACAAHADAEYNRHRAEARQRREAREARERPPMSALEVCILEHETTNRDPQAVNGIYMGIGQWEEGRWISDGGGRYSSTPLGASYAEQEKILRGEGEAGMIQQQGQYDGCA